MISLLAISCHRTPRTAYHVATNMIADSVSLATVFWPYKGAHRKRPLQDAPGFCSRPRGWRWWAGSTEEGRLLWVWAQQEYDRLLDWVWERGVVPCLLQCLRTSVCHKLEKTRWILAFFPSMQDVNSAGSGHNAGDSREVPRALALRCRHSRARDWAQVHLDRNSSKRGSHPAPYRESVPRAVGSE